MLVFCTQVICQLDVDTFLFNLKCIAPVQHNESLHPPVPSSSQIPDAIICLILMFIPQTRLTVAEAIIIIYIAGYISREITKMVCSKCNRGLAGLLSTANSSHVFIAAKRYQDLPTGGLVVPSSVCTLKQNSVIILKRSILVTLMLSKIQGELECDSCKTLQFVVHLYINIRQRHVLRDHSIAARVKITVNL